MAFTYQKTNVDLTKRKALGESNKLFNSMGEKEYESSLKSVITLSLRRTPRASEKNTVVPDKDISFHLTKVPSKNIGATKDDDVRLEYTNSALCGFITPVDTMKTAREQTDLLHSWFDRTIKEAIPSISLGGHSLDWETYAQHRNSITNHNQNAARQVAGQLDQINAQGQMRKKMRAELMARSRMVLSAYTVDISITTTHNIYDSYFVKNFKDDKDIVDYFESRTKLYSRNVTKRISIPVSTMQELEAVFKTIKNLEFNFKNLEVIDKKKVIELCQEPTNESFIQSDDDLASELGFNDNAEVIDNDSFDNLEQLFSLFHSDSNGPVLENENAQRPDSLS